VQAAGALAGIVVWIAWVKIEEDPLDLHAGTAAHAGMEAIRHVEDVVVKAGGAVLRYGGLYGPGATDVLTRYSHPSCQAKSCSTRSSSGTPPMKWSRPHRVAT
jgi:hypothetical protein